MFKDNFLNYFYSYMVIYVHPTSIHLWFIPLFYKTLLVAQISIFLFDLRIYFSEENIFIIAFLKNIYFNFFFFFCIVFKKTNLKCYFTPKKLVEWDKKSLFIFKFPVGSHRLIFIYSYYINKFNNISISTHSVVSTRWFWIFPLNQDFQKRKKLTT